MTTGAWSVETWRAIWAPEGRGPRYPAEFAALRTTAKPLLWIDLDKDTQLRDELHRYSWEAIFSALEGLRSCYQLVPNDAELAFCETPTKPIAELRHVDPMTWVAVEGQVTRIEAPQRLLWEAVYVCPRCPEETWDRLQIHGIGKYPGMWKHEGRCGLPVFLDEAASTWVPSIAFELGGLPDEAGADGQLPTVRVRVDGFMTDFVFGGVTVKVCGVLRAPNPDERDVYIHASSVRPETDEDMERSITPENREYIRGFVARAGEQLPAKIVDSCFGDWVGVENHGLALLLSMLGGVAVRSGREPTTGLLHPILAGDAATAKTALLRRCVMLLGGAFVNGPMATGPGLLASVTGEEGKRRKVEPGAMVRAHRKVLALDEGGRMDKPTRDKMHEALQSGKVHVEKAAWATFNAEATVMIALNPKEGRWNRHDTSITGQTGFEETLLSRFWYIGIFIDERSEAENAALADKILAKRNETSTPGALNDEMLRKYLFIARNLKPKLTADAEAMLKERFVSMRKEAKSRPDGAMPVTARQLDQWISVTQAFAKMRLSETAGVEDAEATIAVYERMLRALSGEDGPLDATWQERGMSRSQEMFQAEIARFLLRQKTAEPGAAYSAARIAEAVGAPDAAKVAKLLSEMAKRGDVVEPRRDGAYRAV